MIKEMKVKDYALLNKVDINFDSGFNVLTGSTGTGKSIIINALSLLLGEKGDVNSIRKEADKATVEGIFSTSKEIKKLLGSYGIPEEELIIRRIVKRKGGGRIYINGTIANLRMLKGIGNFLFDIHGQHEHQLLIDEETHVDFLDSYGKLLKEREKLEKQYKLTKQLKSQLNSAIKEKQEIAEKKELYDFQRKELDSITLSPSEYKELKEEKKKLDNFEEISRIVDSFVRRVSESENSILNTLGEISKDLERASDFDKTLKPLSKRIKESNFILQDASLELLRYSDSLDYDRERLTELEGIVENVERLKRKYSKNYEELLKLKEELTDKIFNIDFLSEKIENLKETIKNEEEKLFHFAEELSKNRREISIEFRKRVEEELKDLGFEKANFKVEIKEKEEIDEKGKDRVRFLFEPNVGEGWNPLSSIASGGELSRVMLALKSILSNVDRVEGLVFDEIDVGIGGSLAKKVGEKMKGIGKKRQVLCVTHLPSIAVEADFHIKVEKKTKDGRTITTVKTVSGKERVEEIARMISGESSKETAIKHAIELLGGSH